MNLEKAGLFVLIAILVGGLASSPVFVSINTAYAQTDDVDVSESDEMEEPTACTMEYAPVCGKDGETYGNMCMLEASDTEFAYDGECETDYEDNDYDKDSVRYHDKRCWETDDGELRCEGHAGKCVRTDDGVRCEAMDKRCWETDDGELRCEGHAGKCVRTDDGIRCEAHDRRCWETDSGELRCEGHDGKCMKTDDGIRCEYEHDYKRDIKMMLDKYCDMTDEEQDRFLAEHDYFREHHDRLANYCEMSEDERDDYRETHHDMMMDFKERHHDMVGEMKDKHHDIRMQKMMERDYKITDERKDELKMKFREKYSDLSDEQRDEIRFEIEAKYDKHFKMKFKARHDSLSDQARADLLQRHSEMRDYKAELRERYDAMTDEERDQFRMDFYSKAKDMRHAWLSPHKQMMAGISVDEIECREGLNLVMKNSNGKVMCMKSSTAERLIEKGIVVPA